MNYDSPAALSALLAENNLSMKKRFGQNFLINPETRARIIGALEPGADELIWEIGPGLGSLTHDMLKTPNRFVLFEIDHGFIDLLKKVLDGYDNFRIVEGDFLKTWKTERTKESPAAIIGNLPYRSGSVMIGDILESGCAAERMVFTLQKEVVSRMSASPGSADFSSFSLLCQYCCEVKPLGDIGRGAFFPRPEVTSAYAVLYPRPEKNLSVAPGHFARVARALFLARRKKIVNNLRASGLPHTSDREELVDLLERTGLSPDRRGETLSVAEAEALARVLC